MTATNFVLPRRRDRFLQNFSWRVRTRCSHLFRCFSKKCAIVETLCSNEYLYRYMKQRFYACNLFLLYSDDSAVSKDFLSLFLFFVIIFFFKKKSTHRRDSIFESISTCLHEVIVRLKWLDIFSEKIFPMGNLLGQLTDDFTLFFSIKLPYLHVFLIIAVLTIVFCDLLPLGIFSFLFSLLFYLKWDRRRHYLWGDLIIGRYTGLVRANERMDTARVLKERLQEVRATDKSMNSKMVHRCSFAKRLDRTRTLRLEFSGMGRSMVRQPRRPIFV